MIYSQKGLPNFGMSKTARNILTFLVVLFIQLSVQSLIAQDNDQMFMFQIDGNTYIRKNYDIKGTFIGSQKFEVGSVTEENGKYKMTVKTYENDEKGTLTDSSKTTYICKPSSGVLLMNIFPYAVFSANKIVKIDLKNGVQFYPSKWQSGLELEDVSFSLSITGGAVGILGNSDRVKLYDRKISSYNAANNTYTIKGKVQLKVYVFGIRVNTIDYSITEIVHPENGIIKQTIKKANGEYFTIKLTNK